MINGIIEGQIGLFDLDIWSGKTFQEHSVQTEAKISKPSLKRSSKSSSRMSPICAQLCRGGWTKAGCLYSEMGTWSIAWRVHDAQFWGVPQRRKRIALVADFGGLSAPEILFERKGLSRNLEPCGKAKEGAAGGTEASSDRTICLQGNGIDRADTAGCNGAGWRRGGSYTLNTIDRPAVMVFEQNQREEVRDLGGVSSAIKAEPGTHNQTFVAGFKAGQSKDGGIGYAEEQSPTLSATPSALEPTVICAGFVGNQGSKAHGIAYELEKSPTLRAGGGGPHCLIQ